jgi:hypothetical protein
MRVSNFEQGTEEWFKSRLGCPSGSGFSKLVTSVGKQSTSADTYINGLIAEKLTQVVPEGYTNEWMQRGTDLEPQARAYYELIREETVQEIGFCKHDTLECGVSPDGLVGLDGGLEIKCPAPATHVKYLRMGKLPSEYKAQVMGCMWITERDWWDFLSFHPDMPAFLIRVTRDQDFINALEAEVRRACEIIEEQVAQLEKLK